jgi:Transferase family
MRQVGISQVDAVFANGSYPIEFLFFFEQSFDTRRLRSALRKLSSLFWPAFGKYEDGAIVFDGYREADCYDEEAVARELDRAEADAAGAEAISRFALPPLKRLFFLKAIRHKNGLALIPKLNHLAGDGYSYFLFLSALAALTRPTLVPFKSVMMSLALKPDHRRTPLRSFSFRGVELKPPVPPGSLRLEGEEILRRDVQGVIREAVSSAGLRVSSNDVLSALAIKRLVAAGARFGAEDVCLTIPVDVRGKVKEYGRGFFGNGILFHTLTLKRAQVEASPVQAIAVQVRRSMPVLSKEGYVDFLIGLEGIAASGKWEDFRPYDPERGCLVTNLSRLPADRLDFGSGPPRLSVPLTIEKNGVGILARGENYLLRFAY